MFEFRLSRDRIGDGVNERPEARLARGLVVPVDRHEHHSQPLCGREPRARKHVAMRSVETRKFAILDAKSARIVGVHLDIRLGVCAFRRALLAVRVMVCHWSRTRPGFSPNG